MGSRSHHPHHGQRYGVLHRRQRRQRVEAAPADGVAGPKQVPQNVAGVGAQWHGCAKSGQGLRCGLDSLGHSVLSHVGANAGFPYGDPLKLRTRMHIDFRRKRFHAFVITHQHGAFSCHKVQLVQGGIRPCTPLSVQQADACLGVPQGRCMGRGSHGPARSNMVEVGQHGALRLGQKGHRAVQVVHQYKAVIMALLRIKTLQHETPDPRVRCRACIARNRCVSGLLNPIMLKPEVNSFGGFFRCTGQRSSVGMPHGRNQARANGGPKHLHGLEHRELTSLRHIAHIKRTTHACSQP